MQKLHPQRILTGFMAGLLQTLSFTLALHIHEMHAFLKSWLWLFPLLGALLGAVASVKSLLKRVITTTLEVSTGMALVFIPLLFWMEYLDLYRDIWTISIIILPTYEAVTKQLKTPRPSLYKKVGILACYSAGFHTFGIGMHEAAKLATSSKLYEVMRAPLATGDAWVILPAYFILIFMLSYLGLFVGHYAVQASMRINLIASKPQDVGSV